MTVFHVFASNNCHRGRVVRGLGHFDHVWSCGVREVVSSNPDRGNIVGWVFHPTRRLARFSLIWTCLSFQILNLFRTLSSWGSINYSRSATFLYDIEVASHVKKLPFRPYIKNMEQHNFLVVNHLIQLLKVNKYDVKKLFEIVRQIYFCCLWFSWKINLLHLKLLGEVLKENAISNLTKVSVANVM